MYFSIFVETVVGAIILTIITKYLALKFNVVDSPDSKRKIHSRAVPLLGGIAIGFSFFLMLYFYLDEILARGLTAAHLTSFFLGALVIIIGGILDDYYDLSPRQQIIFPLFACLLVISGGISIVKITNPGGGFFYFSGIIAAALTIAWLMGMMYTTKLLDGVDGLVSGLGVISGLIIFLFTLTTKYYQPDVALLALIFAAACGGFLLFNFYPAKIFLGEGGSLLVGYIIGILAIISGAKIAIALLIMGIPILDVAWTILRRVFRRQNPFTVPDKLHLHHRLLSSGLSQRQTVLLYYFLAAAFGSTALFLQSRGKLVALVILAIVMVGVSLASILLPQARKS